jgi:hypothetical protein
LHEQPQTRRRAQFRNQQRGHAFDDQGVVGVDAVLEPRRLARAVGPILDRQRNPDMLT